MMRHTAGPWSLTTSQEPLDMALPSFLQDVHEEPTGPLVHPDTPLDAEGNAAAPEEIASDEFGRKMDGSVPR